MNLKTRDDVIRTIKEINGDIINVNSKDYVDINTFALILDKMIFLHTSYSALINKIGDQELSSEYVKDFITNEYNNTELIFSEDDVSLQKTLTK